MTKEDWKEVEDQWSNPYGTIRFRVDGYELSLQALIYKLKVIHQVYVNGWMKGEWINETSEEGRRFMRIKESFLFSAKEREYAKKHLSKATCKKINCDAKIRSVYPWWESFAAFKKHLMANNKKITLIQKESLDFGQ